MSDLIKRSDAIKAVWGDDINPSEDGMVFEAQSHIDRDIRLIPSADRPQGDVDAVAILMREMHNLDQGYITIGKFDERIEPLRHLCYGRPQGEWIDMGDFEKCSVCKGTHLKKFQSYYGKVTWIKTPYCPSCGARMKGADDE